MIDSHAPSKVVEHEHSDRSNEEEEEDGHGGLPRRGASKLNTTQ
jgi:hypothetical protein